MGRATAAARVLCEEVSYLLLFPIRPRHPYRENRAVHVNSYPDEAGRMSCASYGARDGLNSEPYMWGANLCGCQPSGRRPSASHKKPSQEQFSVYPERARTVGGFALPRSTTQF